jgi:3-hydroxybutyryl-CoA dehydrogenase
VEQIASAGVVIEAIVEELPVKCELVRSLDRVLSSSAVIGSNTSSLSIASIAAASSHPERVLGIHFFNPAPLMPLVEVVPGVRTSPQIVEQVRALMVRWKKLPVLAKDTPGFIVNRLARPFYGESLRILEEQIADTATIDWALKTIGGFKMGPFELMDLIGNDINYKVTESVFEAFYYDPRYRPSITQRRNVEAGLLGRKTGAGFYDYAEGALRPKPFEDQALGQKIVERVVAMLINEAAEALLLGIASGPDIDLAMIRGVNYPKGLLAWGDELGVKNVLATLEGLQEEYGDDRYRPSAMLRRLARGGGKLLTPPTSVG